MGMIVYVITIDEVYDFETFDHSPEVYAVFDDAKRRFDDLVAQTREEFAENEFDESQGDTFYETWENGRWPENHYGIYVHTVDLQ